MSAPRGGEIIVGDGQIINVTELDTLIRQNSDLMAIDWRSFDIDPNEIVKFIQPGRDSVALNRILDNKATTILGRLEANGQLFLVNSRGIVFGKHAVVNVGGLLATDLDIDPQDFAAGNFQFSEVAGEQGVVVNRGIIQAAVGGSITLLGHVVRNAGELRAELGRVQLASGSEALVTLDERGLIGLQIQRQVYENLIADEQVLESAAVSNSGTISANGGQVLLKGEVTRDLFTRAVNNSGVIEATSIDMVDGEIILSAAQGTVENRGELNVSGEQTSGSILIEAEQIVMSGSIDASSVAATGGEVIAIADRVLEVKDNATINISSDEASGGKAYMLATERVSLFNGVTVNASGGQGGGEILVGGDYAGAGTGVAAQNSDMTVVDESVFLNADASITGDGGKVVLWSDGVTYFGGSISARGGSLSGDGGFVETSGKETLYFRGDVSTYAENGAFGELLLDPYYIVISDSAAANDGAVGLNDGTVSYTDGGLGTWTISDEALESVSAATNITLEAVYGITINTLSDDLTFDQTGSVSFHAGRGSNTLNAAFFTMDTNNTIQMTGGGALNIYVENQSSGSNTTLTVGNIISDSGSVTIDTNLTDGQLNFGTMNVTVGDITINNADAGSDFIFIRANQYANGSAGNVNLSVGDLTVNGDSPITIEASPLAGQDFFDIGDTAGSTTMNLGNVSVNGNADINIQSLPTADGADSIGTTNLSMGNVAVSGSGNINIIADNPDTPGSMDALQISAGNVSVGGSGDILISGYSYSDSSSRDANLLLGNVSIAGDGDIRLAAGSLSTMSGFSHDTDDVLIRAGDVTVQGTGDIYFLVESNDGTNADTTTIELTGSSYSTSGVGAAVGQGQITFEDNSAAAVVKNFVLNPATSALTISTTANGAVGSTIYIDPDFVWTGNNKDLLLSSRYMTLDWSDISGIDDFTLSFPGSVSLGSDTSGDSLITNALINSFAVNGVNTLNVLAANGITAADVSIAGVPISLNADSDADGVGSFILLDNAVATDLFVDSGLMIVAADVDLLGAISTGPMLTLQASAGQSIGVGAAGVGFDVSQAEINTITTDNLLFSSTDNIQVNADVTVNVPGLSFVADSDSNGVGTFSVDTGFTFDTGDALTSVSGAFAMLNGNLIAGANNLTMTITDDLNVGAGVQISSTTGAIAINVKDDIALAANANISSDSGNITVTADADTNNNGAITLDQTATITASAGKVSLSAYDDIVLGSVTAGFNGEDAIVVDSTAGAVDNADTTETVTNLTALGAAASVRVAAAAGIGASSRVNTDAAAVGFDNSDTGDIHIRNLQDMQLLYAGQAQNNAVGGALILESTGDILLDTTLTTIGGDMQLLADNNIVLTGNSSVYSNNGAVVFTADSNGSGVGAITVPTSVDAGSGSITLSAYDDIAITGLASLATGNAITLSTSNGAIVDNGDTDLDIDANASGALVTLSAATGVGASTGLETNVYELAVSNGSGAIDINEIASLRLNSVSNSAGGIIDIVSTGVMDIVSAGAGISSASTDAINLTVIGAADLNIDAPISGTGGDINLNAQNGSVYLNALVTSQGGNISVSAAQNLALAAANSVASAGGDIQLIADANGDSNGSGGDLLLAAMSEIDAGGGGLLLSADALIQTGMLTNIGSFASHAAQTELSTDLSAQSITQTGVLVLAGNVNSTLGAISLDTVQTTGQQAINSAGDLLVNQLVSPGSSGGSADLSLGTSNDGSVVINSLQISTPTDIGITSEAGVTVGDVDLAGGSLDVLVDSNNNQVATLSVQSLNVQQLDLSGSAARDDVLQFAGAVSSNAITLNSWGAVNIAGLDAQSTIYIEANQINLTGDILSGGAIDLIGSTNLQNNVLIHSGEYAQGGVVQLVGSVVGNQYDLSIDAGNETACACDADITDVGNLSLTGGKKVAVDNVQVSGVVDLQADQEVYIKGALDADQLVVDADANADGAGVVFLGSNSALNVNSDNLGNNVSSIDSTLIDCGPALATLPGQSADFGVDEAEIDYSLELTVQETEHVETMARDNQFTTKVEVSYIKLDCIAGDESDGSSSCRKKKSLHDFLGTFLINHQVPES